MLYSSDVTDGTQGAPPEFPSKFKRADAAQRLANRQIVWY
jgi:hypothetical protein